MSAPLYDSQFQGNRQAFDSLLQRLSAGLVTTFVGAGASVPLVPLWSTALKDMASRFHGDGKLVKVDFAYISKNIGANPLDAAGEIEECVGENAFRARLSSIFSVEPGKYTECHKKLIELGPRAIITTNYDDCLNSAYISVFGKQAAVFSSDEETQVVNWMRLQAENSTACPILHIHGISSRPNSMVITTKDYNKLYIHNRKHQFIEELWRSMSLLVVGFSFTDPFLNIFSQLSVADLAIENKHFAFVGYPGTSVVSTLERRSFERKYRLVPIFYPIKEDEDHSALITLLGFLLSKITPSANQPSKSLSPAAAVGSSYPPISSNRALLVEGLKQDFERNLMATAGSVLYVEPRLMDTPRSHLESETAQSISVDEMARSSDSFIVYTHPECGATSLGKRLAYEIARTQDADVTIRNSTSLPNYRAKLAKEFSTLTKTSQGRVLILDDFDIDCHNRMLKELMSIGIFNRFIMLSKYSPVSMSTIMPSQFSETGVPIKVAHLWHLSRDDIRSLTTQYMNTADTSFVTLAVDKIYGDLLNLCIPLTPTNVLMYLKVLGREHDFRPLNRVHIVERYVTDVLQTPQDAFRDSFPTRRKIEVISAFTYHMYTEKRNVFSVSAWHRFCDEYKKKTLSDFDDRKLLNEALSARIMIDSGGILYFKYRFFYTYFLCRHVSAKSDVLRSFIDGEDYASVYLATAVLSSLQSDNTYLVTTLCDRLEVVLNDFSERYFPKDFDPFREAFWPRNDKEQERVWKPIEEQIKKGPYSHNEIDRIKSSFLSELATEYQEVSFAQFDRYEQKLVMLSISLGEALVNSDDVAGDLKLRATKLVMQAFLVFLQVATILAPFLRKAKYLNWYGLLFINEEVSETKKFSDRELFRFTSGWISGLGQRLIEEIAAGKLGLVFKKLASEDVAEGFIGYLNSLCLIRSKPEGWSNDVENIIHKMPKDAFYLLKILHGLVDELQMEVNSLGNSYALQWLIARVHTKRHAGNTGNKSVQRTLDRLEKQNYFEVIAKNRERQPGT